MSMAWIPTVLMHDLQLSPTYLVRLNASTWMIIIYTFAAFCLSSMLFGRIKDKQEAPALRARVARLLDQGAFRPAILITFVVGLLVFLYNVFERGGPQNLPILAGVSTKWTYLLPVVGQLVLLMDVAVLWSFLYIGAFGLRSSRWVVVPMALVALQTALLASRSNLFALILAGLVVVYLMRQPDVTARVPALVLAVMLAAFLIIGAATGAMERSQELVATGRIVVPHYALAHPYIYLTASITNLQLAVEQTTTFSGGARTFGPILSMLQLADTSSFPDYPTYWGGGIVPYQGTLYLDFGYAGLMIGPIVLGALSGWLHRRTVLGPSVLHVVAYGVFASAVMTSGITNWFALGRTWIYLVASLGFYTVMRAAGIVKRLEPDEGPSAQVGGTSDSADD
jgi:oligosaccharide repeat unit polymerase